jgi:TolB-like protein/tetratricopeptide (TPR) repeat protein
VVESVGQKRIAVLPPVSIGGAADQEHLVLALHEALISHVGAGDVAVLARTSVLQYQGVEGPAAEVCRELAVESVVESSVFSVGEALEVQARLVDGATGENLWSGSFQGSLGEVLSVFRTATQAAADGIHNALGLKTGQETKARKVDPVAYERYMRGRVHQQSFNPADILRAVQYFEAALTAQPDYAPAHAGISLAHGSMAVLGMAPASEYGSSWIEAAQRAVELDPTHAEGYQALAQARTWYDWDWGAAEEAYRRAIELDPNEPQARIFYSHFLAMMHRPEESDEQIARAVEIDPYNPFTQMLRGIQRGLTGRREEGIEQLTVVPPNPLRSFALSWQNMTLGNMDVGVREYRTYFELLGDTDTASAMNTDDGDLEAALVRGAEVLVERSKQTFVKPNNMIHLFSWGGDIDRAVEWMERSYEMRDHELVYMSCLGANPLLRADARFKEMMTRLELPVPAPEWPSSPSPA